MNKLLFAFIFLTSSLYALEIKWLDNYHMARQQAKKENKNILLFITQKDNPFCEVMEEDTFKNTEVVKYINKDYLAVRLVQNIHRMPRGLGHISAPSIYFLTPKGKEIIRKVIGEVTARQMKVFLKKASKKL